MSVNRRKFLIAAPISIAGAGAMVSTAFAAPLGAASHSFAAIVRQIGGVSVVPDILAHAAEDEFINVYGSAARANLIDVFARGTIEARLATAEPAMLEQIQFIARFLYTGEVERDGVTKALYYPWCLSWTALTFASAPGLCGGPAFGHWGNAPMPGAM